MRSLFPLLANGRTLRRSGIPGPGGAPPALSWLGTNIGPVMDYSAQHTFKNALKQGRDWMSQDPSGSPWDNGLPISLDANGYPTALEVDQVLVSLLLWDIPEATIPVGSYTLSWDGDGTVTTQVFGGGNRLVKITATNPADPVTNVKYLFPGEADDSNPWKSELLTMLTGFGAIRFMDWASVNDATITQWSQRRQPGEIFQTASPGSIDAGVAYELQIDLANRMGCDAWFCVPHGADNDFITQLCTLVMANLDPTLKAYFELSNEVWNGQFTQYNYFRDIGLADGLDVVGHEANLKAYSRRCQQMFDIIDTVYGGARAARAVRVVAGHSYASGNIGTLLNYNNLYLKTDAYATAPYFYAEGATNAMTVSDILDILEGVGTGVAQARTIMQANLDALASYPGVTLVAYEGGQHLQSGDSALNALYLAANAHARMEAIYATYLEDWRQVTGGTLFCHYYTIGPWGASGAWGSAQSYGELATSPKTVAIDAIVK